MGRRPDVGALAARAVEVASRWGVELGEAFSRSQFSFVAPAGGGAVLKMVPLEDDESAEEPQALAFWDGVGAVRLLRHDAARKAMLLERATPGTDISRLPSDQATRVATTVGRLLWRPAAEPFRWIGDHVPGWMEAAEASPEPGTALLPLARELYGSMRVGRRVLVHGDLQHYNILRSQRGYLAIDPKPMLGEPEFDVPAFLWNPLTYKMELGETLRRLSWFAAAGLDEERMRKWAVIRGAYLGAETHEVDVLRAIAP